MTIPLLCKACFVYLNLSARCSHDELKAADDGKFPVTLVSRK